MIIHKHSGKQVCASKLRSLIFPFVTLAMAYQFSFIIFPANVSAVPFILSTINSDDGTPTDMAFDPLNKRIVCN